MLQDGNSNVIRLHQTTQSAEVFIPNLFFRRKVTDRSLLNSYTLQCAQHFYLMRSLSVLLMLAGGRRGVFPVLHIWALKSADLFPPLWIRFPQKPNTWNKVFTLTELSFPQGIVCHTDWGLLSSPFSCYYDSLIGCLRQRTAVFRNRCLFEAEHKQR